MIRESSKEAYAQLIAVNGDCQSRQVILDYMLKNPDTDYTRGELNVLTGIAVNRITPRVLELIQLGHLDELPRRKSPFSNVACHALKLSETYLMKVAA
jgi:hypothetical protein